MTATCPTHGDPLVCIACEQEEDARPEWQGEHTLDENDAKACEVACLHGVAERIREAIARHAGWRTS